MCWSSSRGDLEVNETKLRNYLRQEIHPALIDRGMRHSSPASSAPWDCKGKINASCFDRSLEGHGNLVCGANEADYHYTGFNIERDYGDG